MDALRAGLVALLLVSGSAYAQSGDEQAIRDLETRFVDAFNAKDVNAIMKVYAPDVLVFDVVPPRQYVGADAYRKDWQNTFAMMPGPIKFSISDLNIAVDGDHAYSHSIQYVNSIGKDGKPITLNVRVTDVYKKTADNWQIVHEHVSVPVDLETGQPDVLSKP